MGRMVTCQGLARCGLPHKRSLGQLLTHLQAPDWYYGDGERCRIIEEVARNDKYVRYEATPEGRAVLDVVFEDYQRIFLD